MKFNRKEWLREYRAQKKARGECADCPNDVYKDKTRCKNCLVYRALQQMKSRMKDDNRTDFHQVSESNNVQKT